MPLGKVTQSLASEGGGKSYMYIIWGVLAVLGIVGMIIGLVFALK